MNLLSKLNSNAKTKTIEPRLIIFPKYVNGDISEFDIREKVEKISEIYNVVILVPSFSRAKFWDEKGLRTAKKDNIDRMVAALKRGKHVGKMIFVNRYDGIDLPGDACRMLVIDGLPPLNSIKDRYIQSVAPQSTTLLREQVQRIEQGMGRGVRSNDDECCIVLMGDELTDVLSRNRGIDYFSAATRCQYDLSKQLWDLLVSETGSKPTIDQIFELANYSLEKDAEWVTTCKENLAAVKYSNEAKIDEKIVAQRKAFEKAMNMQWLDAANTIKIVIDKGGSRIAIIHNGSPLFTGDAGSGPSEIRRYILEQDLLEAIIALPNDIFYNTGIATYIWVLSNKKAGTVREGKVQLINANEMYVKRRKALGNKRNDISEEDIAEITKIYGDFKENEISQIYDNEDFGYTKITVERSLRDADGNLVLKKGKKQPDTSLRDTENVPLKEDIKEYFEREVLPFAPDAWIDEKKSKVGYEIPFTRYFYKYEAPRPSAEIMAEIMDLETELSGSLEEVFDL